MPIQVCLNQLRHWNAPHRLIQWQINVCVSTKSGTAAGWSCRLSLLAHLLDEHTAVLLTATREQRSISTRTGGN